MIPSRVRSGRFPLTESYLFAVLLANARASVPRTPEPETGTCIGGSRETSTTSRRAVLAPAPVALLRQTGPAAARDLPHAAPEVPVPMPEARAQLRGKNDD